MSDDPFDLARFIEAQAGVVDAALSELRDGCKRSHWMWFVFPQIEGLGSSPMARRYAIGSMEEARAYIEHPLLGPRLLACANAALSCGAPSAHALFGSPDDLKFRSSMTLFAACAPDKPVFRAALDRYFGGESDALTLARIGGE